MSVDPYRAVNTVSKDFGQPAGIKPAVVREAHFESRDDFASSVSLGLRSDPRCIPSRFLYDARGSLLFELITRQPEYYLTRTESSILAESAGRIREIAGSVSIMEFGSGSSKKTGFLLGAWLSREASVVYIPVDVSESALKQGSRMILQRFPMARVIPLHADYGEAFSYMKEASPVMATFLGSSIGNFDEPEMSRFLLELGNGLAPGDFFLAGFDLVKEPSVIEAAYNDAAGATAEFTRNLFVRMNRELGSGIDPGTVEHRACYNAEMERVETDALFTSRQQLRVAPRGERYYIAEGETIRTEISRKFRIDLLIPYLEYFGFKTREIFTDAGEWYALVLLQKIEKKNTEDSRQGQR